MWDIRVGNIEQILGQGEGGITHAKQFWTLIILAIHTCM